MISEEIIRKAAEAGLPALKELFDKIPKEDILRALGILSTTLISWKAIEEVRKICMSRIE